MSALLLAKLITSVKQAIEMEIALDEPLCFSDSRVSLYWIRGRSQEWKQFVENRVNSIREMVGAELWFHCAGVESLADIPSRDMSVSELHQSG